MKEKPENITEILDTCVERLLDNMWEMLIIYIHISKIYIERIGKTVKKAQ